MGNKITDGQEVFSPITVEDLDPGQIFKARNSPAYYMRATEGRVVSLITGAIHVATYFDKLSYELVTWPITIEPDKC